MKVRFTFLIPLFVALMIAGSAAAQSETLRKSHFNLEKGLAVEGYDPVAYFTEGKAVKGSKSFSVVHAGVTYQFASEANKNIFKANPEKYEPQYGGWCAYAMGDDGSKVSVDPETFKVLDGKLYLFYNSYFNNTLKKWNKNETNLKRTADANWSKTFH